MKKFLTFASILSIATSLYAMDLKGTWVDEDNWGVKVGHGEHSSNPNSEKVKWLNKNSKLSLTITEQNGKAFTAKWCSPKKI